MTEINCILLLSGPKKIIRENKVCKICYIYLCKYTKGFLSCCHSHQQAKKKTGQAVMLLLHSSLVPNDCVKQHHFNFTSFYRQDYLTTGRMMPMPDKEQNYMMMSASEMNGYTNLVFYRKRDTGDAEQDVVIKVR